MFVMTNKDLEILERRKKRHEMLLQNGFDMGLGPVLSAHEHLKSLRLDKLDGFKERTEKNPKEIDVSSDP